MGLLYRFWRYTLLFIYFVYELIVSSVRVAHDVLTPRSRAKPGIIAIPLDVTTDAQITMLANLISLTPGSLSLDVSADRRVIYAHLMFIDDADEERAAIKTGMERKVLETMS